MKDRAWISDLGVDFFGGSLDVWESVELLWPPEMFLNHCMAARVLFGGWTWKGSEIRHDGSDAWGVIFGTHREPKINNAFDRLSGIEQQAPLESWRSLFVRIERASLYGHSWIWLGHKLDGTLLYHIVSTFPLFRAGSPTSCVTRMVTQLPTSSSCFPLKKHMHHALAPAKVEYELARKEPGLEAHSRSMCEGFFSGSPSDTSTVSCVV